MHGSLRLCLVTVLVTSLIPYTTSQLLAQSTSSEKQPDSSVKPAQPRPNPNASGIYHVGDGVTAPVLIYSVEPEFSEKSRKLKMGGMTVLRLIVETDGHVRDIRVVKSCAEAFTNKKDREAAVTLDQQALKAASQYRFNPAQYKGKPVPVELSISIDFQLF